MRLNVTSEIGRLKSVLVHLPGREIDVMVPPMMDQLLFDDILYGQVAREEHRRFQQLIRFVAPTTSSTSRICSRKCFEDEDSRRRIVRDLAKRNRSRPQAGRRASERAAGVLAETLIGGIPHESDGNRASCPRSISTRCRTTSSCAIRRSSSATAW